MTVFHDEVELVSASPVAVVEPEEWMITPVNVSAVPELVEPVDTGVSVDPDASILPEDVMMISSVHESSVKEIVMTTLSFCVPEYSYESRRVLLGSFRYTHSFPVLLRAILVSE